MPPPPKKKNGGWIRQCKAERTCGFLRRKHTQGIPRVPQSSEGVINILPVHGATFYFRENAHSPARSSDRTVAVLAVGAANSPSETGREGRREPKWRRLLPSDRPFFELRVSGRPFGTLVSGGRRSSTRQRDAGGTHAKSAPAPAPTRHRTGSTPMLVPTLPSVPTETHPDPPHRPETRSPNRSGAPSAAVSARLRLRSCSGRAAARRAPYLPEGTGAGAADLAQCYADGRASVPLRISGVGLSEPRLSTV